MIGDPEVAEFQGKPYEMSDADRVSNVGHYHTFDSQIWSVNPAVHKDSPVNVRMGDVPER